MKGTFSFTAKYIIALSIIAIFSISAYINLTILISSQEDDVKIINISGKQRMLSQQVALFATNSKEEELQHSAEMMEEANNYLTSRPMSDELKKIYFEAPLFLNQRVKDYVGNAYVFIERQESNGLQYILKDSQLILKSDQLRYILGNSQELLKDLDQVVSIYQKYSEEKTVNLRNNELYIMLFVIATLFIEALFIFRPANNTITANTKILSSEKKYADMIIETNTNAIIAINQNFEVLTFNKSAEEMFGYTAKEMIGSKMVDATIIPKKYLKQHNAGLEAFMKSGELKHNNDIFELEGQRKDKTIFPMKISFGVKIEDNTKIVVASIQNIQKEKEKDELIIQQSRTAAMGEMIGNIAHQWRQPLSSISTIATGAKIRYKNKLITDEELDETFAKIKEHTQYLSKTIDDFRNFFNEDKKVELFDIGEVVSKSVALTDASYKDNNIKLKLHTTNGKVGVNGSSSELSQVFINILNNAKDALLKSEKRVVLITLSEVKENIVITIADSAGGVPEDIREKIFDPYFTTKHKSQGTGIGLFMSKKIITQKFDGEIEVKNKDFELDDEKYFGAEFKITIQLA